MKPLKISAIQRGAVYDGKGVRTTVFLSGCSLSCPWCCNPETVFCKDYFIDMDKCSYNQAKFQNICRDCVLMSGNRLQQDCPFGLVKPTYIRYEPSTLYEVLLKDLDLFLESRGGVTFSGGEPLLQAESLRDLLAMLKEKNVNIIFETTLYVPVENLIIIDPYIDEYIVDLKLQPEMFLRNKVYIDKIKEQLRIIKDKAVHFRLVFVNGMEAVAEEIINNMLYLGIGRLQLLKCHDLGKKKYLNLNLPFNSYAADIERFNKLRSELIKNNIEVEILQA
ncbi:4Fe-4S cluster-binding domain-containing protein [Muribaculum intestinale]|uniref:4Fe-4S cluster-binding domain-containing protein n=1 Tax=Muribaculum intestinale TaxID=1796646 RepID=UPI002635DBCF|nr:4Fe-4S cluster-binding domain-containing protein [Muribaculum intestinale]